MNLFSDETTNILPQDGIVNYYGRIMSDSDADYYYNRLAETIKWERDVVVIFGKRIRTKREVAWYGESGIEYTYSGTTKRAILWTEELLGLKRLVEAKTGEKFNSCLLNLYHSGHEGMGWHNDAEKALKKNGAISSLSFGAERKFVFKHKTSKETVSIVLEHGSLLVMKGYTQTHWLHRLPPAKLITRPRINLTFRIIITS